MKKVLLFAVALCYLMSAPAQPIKNEPKAQKTWKTTNQQVKKLNRHENSFITKLDSVTADWIKYAYDYDARCNCVRKTGYDFDNEYGWFASCQALSLKRVSIDIDIKNKWNPNHNRII